MTSSTAAARPVDSVFVVEPQNQGWIIERLMRDIAAELGCRGIATRFGPSADYAGEDVIFNSRYLVPFSDKRARVNSLFITHVDDRVKEMELQASVKGFNSLVCMSPHEADFIAGLRGGRTGVIGIDLPARDMSVAPTRLALFTARYADDRKNEKWILDYFRDKGREHKDGFIICLMGFDWEPFCAVLGEMEMSYEVYRYSRYTPGEYGMYKTVLSSMDSLAYLGFDGGAMCVYDAISAGVDVIATDISYHRGLGETVSLISDKDAFFAELDRLHARNMNRKAALGSRSVARYVDLLTDHWNTVANGGKAVDVLRTSEEAETAAVQLFRSHYKPVGYSRLRSFGIRLLQRLTG